MVWELGGRPGVRMRPWVLHNLGLGLLQGVMDHRLQVALLALGENHRRIRLPLEIFSRVDALDLLLPTVILATTFVTLFTFAFTLTFAFAFAFTLALALTFAFPQADWETSQVVG